MCKCSRADSQRRRWPNHQSLVNCPTRSNDPARISVFLPRVLGRWVHSDLTLVVQDHGSPRKKRSAQCVSGQGKHRTGWVLCQNFPRFCCLAHPVMGIHPPLRIEVVKFLSRNLNKSVAQPKCDAGSMTFSIIGACAFAFCLAFAFWTLQAADQPPVSGRRCDCESIASGPACHRWPLAPMLVRRAVFDQLVRCGRGWLGGRK